MIDFGTQKGVKTYGFRNGKEFPRLFRKGHAANVTEASEVHAARKAMLESQPSRLYRSFWMARDGYGRRMHL